MSENAAGRAKFSAIMIDRQPKAAATARLDMPADRAEMALRHLAAIVESSEDAIISKDLNGIIQSWNDAAQRMFGYDASEILGKPVLTLIPPDRHHEEDVILGRLRRGERIAHFETVRRAKDGRLLDISLTISPVKDAAGNIIGASKIARDITAEKRDRRQLEILYRASTEITRDLKLERVAQTVIDLATEASGAKFGVFFYNLAGRGGETTLLYSLSGVLRDEFEKLELPRHTAIFQDKTIIRSGDIRKDPRYQPHFGVPPGDLPVASYLAVPVLSADGQVHGSLLLGHDQPDMFGEEAQSLVAAIASQAAVAMDNARLHHSAEIEIEQRKKAEETKELLLNEIKHRVKNTLSTVQAMAAQTFCEAPAGERKAFGARIQALAEAHDGLTQGGWRSSAMTDTAERAMRPFMDGREERIVLVGPAVELNPNTALLVSMLLHELGTNAVKYGAFSNLSGSVNLTWRIEQSDDKAILRLDWHEAGGPPVQAPTRKGFGSRLIERALQGENGAAEMCFEPAGLRCSLTIPLAMPLAG